MSKQKIRFIINPISGKSHRNDLPAQIERVLNTARFEYDIKVSEYAGHSRVLAQEAVNDHYDIVAAVGGDGTINEVGVEPPRPGESPRINQSQRGVSHRYGTGQRHAFYQHRRHGLRRPGGRRLRTRHKAWLQHLYALYRKELF